MNDCPDVIRVSDITVRQNGLIVLDRVSLTVAKGEFTALIGPNGAGKTTLIRVILGLVKPSAGTAEVLCEPAHKLGAKRTKIGYVPQIFDIDLNFPVTVFEVVLMGTYGRLGVAKRPGPQEHAAALEALEKVGVSDLRSRPIGRLSSGQRQRVFIARALANGPELLLLDEPTTGVDVETTSGLYTLLSALKKEQVTILIASHDIGVVAAYTDKVACLNKSLVAHGRPDEIGKSDALKKMYGGHVAYLHHGEAPHIVVEDH